MTERFRFDWVVVPKPTVRKARTPAADDAVGPSVAPSGFEGGELAAAAPIRTESMTMAEAAEERRSAKTAATLVEMPLRLIEPMRRKSEKAGRPPEEGISWGVRDTNAHRSTRTGQGVIVAVLDTGIDAGHVAFGGVDLVQRDFTGSGVADTDGHGTHCAGSIFGRDVGGERIGIARGVTKALIGKVLGGPAGGSTRSLVQALHWAQSEGADVVSMSLGMDFPGYLAALIEIKRLEARRAAAIALEAYRLNLEMFNKLSESVIGVPGLVEGSVVIGAAGNESEMPDYTIAASLPANALDFVSVAALQAPSAGAYALAPFSNVGAKLGAPGVSIRSAQAGGDLVAMDGTSMAAPLAAGVACLWIEELQSQMDSVDAPTVIDRLKTSAASLTPSISSAQVKWGRVQAPHE
jgi:subtilisin family serine protease